MKKLWKGGEKALENFKAFAHNTRHYPQDQPLTSGPVGDWLLYAANPVYLEVTQGGTSSIRGFAAIIWMGGAITCLYIGAGGFISGMQDSDWISIIFAPILFIGGLIPASLVYISFFLPTDIIVRFDRKRQLAHLWTPKGPIEIPWANLTPIVQGMATSPMLPSRTYRGMHVEYAPDGEPRSTHGVPHIIQVGQPSGTEECALFFLEYVRRYMKEGLHAVPRPQKWLRHRPRWRAMFNFINCVDEWEMELERPSQIPPWGTTVLLAVMFPLLFPMQVTHWLALKVAPRPHWPRQLEATHAADLAELGLRPREGWQEAPRRQPVVRLNGELQPPALQAEPMQTVTDGNWRDRLAAWVAVPLAFASPILFWGGLADLLPFKMTLTQIFVWPLLMGFAATAIALLSLPSVKLHFSRGP